MKLLFLSCCGTCPLGNHSLHCQGHEFAFQLQSGPWPRVCPLLSMTLSPSVTAVLRADATRANFFPMYCNHAQTLQYEATSNVEELGTRIFCAPCF